MNESNGLVHDAKLTKRATYSEHFGQRKARSYCVDTLVTLRHSDLNLSCGENSYCRRGSATVNGRIIVRDRFSARLSTRHGRSLEDKYRYPVSTSPFTFSCVAYDRV